MFHWVYRFLAPRNWQDALFKVALFTGLIILLNYGFNQLYYGQVTGRHVYIVLNSICVGTPFVVLFFFLVQKQVRLQRELAVRSRTDAMTGLSNRRYFLKRVHAALEDGISGVLLILDADHFKNINDTHGNLVGDECLEEIAYRLKRGLRTDDIIGRIGGEEFGLFLTNTSPQHVRSICAPLLEPIPFSSGGNQALLSVTLSMGASCMDPGDDLDTAMKSADEALYRAKENGRARLEFAESIELTPEPGQKRGRTRGSQAI
jgi:diguanylate cyclase (GGDEF)-like protein